MWIKKMVYLLVTENKHFFGWNPYMYLMSKLGSNYNPNGVNQSIFTIESLKLLEVSLIIIL